MSDVKTVSSPPKLIASYAVQTFSVLVLVLALNFYQVLIVSPDKIDMKTFNQALLSSPGFWLDLLRFIAGLMLIHLAWFFALWLGTAGWLARVTITNKERKLLQWLLFLVSAFFFIIWSNRLYPNMQGSGFLRTSYFLISDLVFYSLACIFAVSAVISLPLLFNKRVVVVIAAMSLAVGLAVFKTDSSEAHSGIVSKADSQPNIFIIGVDSLRPDQTGYFGSDGELTPHIDEFLNQSTVFESAYTPYARTFPAWMSILTGLDPVNHKGRFNLINHSHIDKSANLASWLKKRDYHTMFAFDERRFNSIDESFGFDSVVGPDYGALGFVLGGFDHPIVNLICNTVVGKWLFPEMYLNRGRDANYDPERYTQAILDMVKAENKQPIFLSAHFLLPHWPWLSRDWEQLKKFEYGETADEQALYNYRLMIKQADQQFGEFMHGLKEMGALDNAYVFFLSDHGDGFQLDGDNLNPAVSDSEYDIFANTRGHATNVLNTGQYRVVLAARAYGQGEFLPELRKGNASLVDIVPTLSELLGGKPLGERVDGVSLLSASDDVLNTRPLFMETGFVVLEITREEIDEKRLISETIGAYSVDSDGKVVVRPDFEEMIIKAKHRAVLSGDWQLTMIPSLGQRLVLSNVKERKWWPVSRYEGDADWRKMLSKMCFHYKDDAGFDPAGLCELHGVGHGKVALSD